MTRYIPCGCSKCDFSESRHIPRTCKLGMCNSYEESYMKAEVDNCEIGYATLEEFNTHFGTNWEE